MTLRLRKTLPGTNGYDGNVIQSFQIFQLLDTITQKSDIKMFLSFAPLAFVLRDKYQSFVLTRIASLLLHTPIKGDQPCLLMDLQFEHYDTSLSRTTRLDEKV